IIDDLPSPVLGVISGLLPALLISALLALVPIICRFLAVWAGSVTLSQVELKTEGWYFAFQVVQVFLITTFSSGASSVAKQIVDDLSQAPELLAKNLPKASNFYLSFFVLQGLTVAATTVFQVLPLIMFSFLGKILDRTPRKKYNRWITLAGLSWGDTYPRFTNLAVIAIAYSCIAPLVLGFATIGFYLLYLAFRYNLFYALTTTVDTKGDAYGRALQHLTVGVYLTELCLIGLFAASGGTKPAQLMVFLFILTILYQTYMNLVLTPLENTLSDDPMAEDEVDARAQASIEDGAAQPDEPARENPPNPPIEPTGSGWMGKLAAHCARGGLFAPFLFHGSRISYLALRAQLRSAFPGQPLPSLPEDAAKDAYFNPAVTVKTPKLWVAKDDIGISKEEVEKTKKVVEITDEGARFDGKGNIVWDQEKVREAPIWKERVEY
ncbi:phosphate metabolism protein 7, partial [Cryomyces antarcticus]